MPYQIEIDGVIGWDVWPSMISQKLKEANGDEVEILFSSPGGYIDDGLAIFNLIYDYQGKTTSKIIGMAASMASYIPLAADKVIAKSNAVYMIHDALAGLYGNESEHSKIAKILGGFSNMLADIYMKKTGKTREEIRDLMKEESYFFGSEMRDAGFVDEIEEIDVNQETPKDQIINEAMASARLAIEKVRSRPEDYSKIAAMIRPKDEIKTGLTEPAEEPEESAQARTQTKTEVNMTLDEYLAQNPEAKAEYDKRLNVAKNEGIQAVREDVKKLSMYLQSDEYDSAIKETAIDALNGEIEISAFLTTVKIEDRRKEKARAEAANEETPPETPSSQSEVPNPEKPKTVDDMKEAVAKMKKGGK